MQNKQSRTSANDMPPELKRELRSHIRDWALAANQGNLEGMRQATKKIEALHNRKLSPAPPAKP